MIRKDIKQRSSPMGDWNCKDEDPQKLHRCVHLRQTLAAAPCKAIYEFVVGCWVTVAHLRVAAVVDVLNIVVSNFNDVWPVSKLPDSEGGFAATLEPFALGSWGKPHALLLGSCCSFLAGVILRPIIALVNPALERRPPPDLCIEQ